MSAGRYVDGRFREVTEQCVTDLVTCITKQHDNEVTVLQTAVEKMRAELESVRAQQNLHPGGRPAGVATIDAASFDAGMSDVRSEVRSSVCSVNSGVHQLHVPEEVSATRRVSESSAEGALPRSSGAGQARRSCPYTPAATGNDSILERKGARSHTQESMMFSLHDAWNVDQVTKKSIEKRSKKTRFFLGQPRSFMEEMIFIDAQLEEDAGRYAIHPSSRRRACWDMVALAFLLFDFVTIPLQAMHLPQTTFLRSVELCALLYWTLDIVATCCTGTYKNGVLLMRHREIVRRYLRTWMPFDLLVVGVDWFGLLYDAVGSHSAGVARILRMSRLRSLNRVLRLCRIVKVFKLFNELKLRINNNHVVICLNICKLLLGIIMLVHLLSCSWYQLGQWAADGWVYKEDITHGSLAQRYLFTFQWAMASLHPSNFHRNLALGTNTERMFAIAVSFLAIGCGSYFISSVTNSMGQLNKYYGERTRKLWAAREYMQDRGIKDALAIKVRKFVERDVARNLRRQHETELLEILPARLLTEVHFEAWRPFVSKNYFFGLLCRNHAPAMWHLCRDAFEEVSLQCCETVFTTGDVCSRMYFVVAGEFIYVIGTTGTPHRHRDVSRVESRLVKGNSICEAALWTSWKNVGDLGAFTDSTIVALCADNFLHVITRYEDAMLQAMRRANAVVQWLNANDLAPSDLLPSSVTTGPTDGLQRESFTSMVPIYHANREFAPKD